MEYRTVSLYKRLGPCPQQVYLWRVSYWFALAALSQITRTDSQVFRNFANLLFNLTTIKI